MDESPISATIRDLKLLRSDGAIFRTALGIAFFWMLASLANINIDPYGGEVLGMEKETIGTLGATLVLGVGIGSVLAGLLSAGKVELGLVPVGATGIAISSVLLLLSGNAFDPALPAMDQPAFYWSCFWLFTLGVASGFFDVPLEANLQHRSDPSQLGTILAATNFLTFTFIMLASGLFFVMKKVLGMSPGEIFMVAGLGTIPVIFYAFKVLPQATIRFVVWLFSFFVYRIRVIGRENVPTRSGALKTLTEDAEHAVMHELAYCI